MNLSLLALTLSLFFFHAEADAINPAMYSIMGGSGGYKSPGGLGSAHGSSLLGGSTSHSYGGYGYGSGYSSSGHSYGGSHYGGGYSGSSSSYGGYTSGSYTGATGGHTTAAVSAPVPFDGYAYQPPKIYAPPASPLFARNPRSPAYLCIAASIAGDGTDVAAWGYRGHDGGQWSYSVVEAELWAMHACEKSHDGCFLTYCFQY